MSKKILLILGHPSNDNFCGALAQTYTKAAEAAGHEVKTLQLANLKFDPILHQGYKVIQALEPDLVEAQRLILWADHLSFVFPIWWGSVPAILKGFLDRVFLPGFAFRFQKGATFQDKLLAGRSAHMLITMDTPPWYFKWFYRMPGIHQMKKTTLEFCGIKPVKVMTCGPMVNSTVAHRTAWLAQAEKLAASLK
jgi:NAD(P)H dehydrogenase (quinone)